jgi:Carboxypeptidase regulatory-like domain
VDFDASVHTDSEGRYVITDIPAGTYALEAVAPGLRPEVIEVLVLDVGRSVVRDFRLQIGEWSEAVIVSAEIPLIDAATSVVARSYRTDGPTFGKITRTRFSTGEAGSSRQIQLVLKAWF